jgi:hypothetical protein
MTDRRFCSHLIPAGSAFSGASVVAMLAPLTLPQRRTGTVDRRAAVTAISETHPIDTAVGERQ